MKFYCLGSNPSANCFVVKFKNVHILLDCAFESDAFLSFIPAIQDTRHSLNNSPYNQNFENNDTRKQENNVIIKQIANNMFINDPANIKFQLPQFGLIDPTSIDVVLVSNYLNLLALPFLTEYTGFRGQIYATEPTKYLGRQLLIELVQYMEQLKTVPLYTVSSVLNSAQTALWQQENFIQTLSSELLKRFPNVSEWRSLYTLTDVESCMSKIKAVSYRQEIRIFDSVLLMPLSSGYCLGSANWIIQSDFEKIVFVSHSAQSGNRHSSPLDDERIAGCDVMIMSNHAVVSPLQSSFTQVLADLCSRIGVTLHNRGNVLIPCQSTALILDLFDVLVGYLKKMNFHNVPIYFISPVGDALLAYSDIVAEWLCKSRQDKVYLPEPPYSHGEFIKAGKIKHFSNIYDGKFGQAFHQPCIIIGGHPSLRCGDMMHLTNAWKHDPKNAIIFIGTCSLDPDYDWLRALAPFEPIKMNVYFCPLDSRLTSVETEELLQKWKPRILLLPERDKAHISEMKSLDIKIIGFSHLNIIPIKLKRKYERCQLAPDLATNLQGNRVGEKVVTHLSGLLWQQDGIFYLEPLASSTSSASVTAEQSNNSNSRSTNKDIETAEQIVRLPRHEDEPHQLWRIPQIEKIITALHELGIVDVTVTCDASTSEKFLLKIPSLQSEVTVGLHETSILSESEHGRTLLTNLIVKHSRQ